MIRRVSADALVAAGVLFFPWWLTLVLCLVFFFCFEAYQYEFLAAALSIDIIYGVPVARFAGVPLITFALSAVLLAFLVSVRKRLRV